MALYRSCVRLCFSEAIAEHCGIDPSHSSAMYCWDCAVLYVSHAEIIGFAKGDEIKAHSSNLEPLRLTERNRAGGVCVYAHVPLCSSV